MSKSKKVNIEKRVLSKITTGQIKMKPRWYFIVGSILTVAGLSGLIIGAIFLTNLFLFLLRKQGPGIMRLERMTESFPWWILIFAVVGIFAGIKFLKKYDFSYKKNFSLIILAFISSIIISAWLIDFLGLNEIWSRRGPMRKFYQQFERQKNNFPDNRDRPRYQFNQR